MLETRRAAARGAGPGPPPRRAPQHLAAAASSQTCKKLVANAGAKAVGAAATGGRAATAYAADDHEAALHTAEVSASRAKDLSLRVHDCDDGAPLGCAMATDSTDRTTVAMAKKRQRSAGSYNDEATLDSVSASRAKNVSLSASLSISPSLSISLSFFPTCDLGLHPLLLARRPQTAVRPRVPCPAFPTCDFGLHPLLLARRPQTAVAATVLHLPMHRYLAGAPSVLGLVDPPRAKRRDAAARRGASGHPGARGGCVLCLGAR